MWPRYYFGVYHWRRRFRRVGVALAALLAAVAAWRGGGRLRRVVALGLAGLGVRRAVPTLRRLFGPPPWAVDRGKYRLLTDALPLDGADRVLDVGCGTGRSLVGLADAVPADCSVVGVDVFDDRVILGNGPRLAARNARAAGLDASPVAGDAARLPVADDSVDAVTACRVLHDLPAADARSALEEARRVLRPDGRLGVLELPIPHDPDADPERYWRDLLADAGFVVERATARRDEGDGGDGDRAGDGDGGEDGGGGGDGDGFSVLALVARPA